MQEEMTMEPLDLVFWPAPVRQRPFEAHVRAAAAGGFTSLAIAPTTYTQARASGLSNAGMKRVAGDHGIALRHLDMLTTWAPNQLDSGDFDAEMNERWNTPLDRGLEICAKLGLVQILATAAYQKDAVPLQQLIDGFCSLCERAAKLGVWVDLEPMPFLDDGKDSCGILTQGFLTRMLSLVDGYGQSDRRAVTRAAC